MSYSKAFLLVFFSAMIGLMAVFKPLLINNKKTFLAEQKSESSCPDSGGDEPIDEETGKEDTEWGDEFDFVPHTIIGIPTLRITFVSFAYLAHSPEYFASICIPPPEM